MPWKKVIRHLPNLKQVSYMHADDHFLSEITRYCPNIEYINLNYSRVSNYGIDQLCCEGRGKPPCPRLKKLLVDKTEVDGDGIKNLLKNVPSLEKIDYRRLPEILHSLHTSDIGSLDNVKSYKLTHLNLMYLTSRSFSNVLKICSLVCPHLESFSCPIVEQRNLDLCSKFQKLKRLHLHHFSDSFVALDDFLKLKGSKLDYLHLCNFSVSAPILAQSCPFLKSLHLNTVTFQSRVNDFYSIFALHYLKKISFKKLTLLDSFTIQPVTNFLLSAPNLRILCFKNCRILFSEVIGQVLKTCGLHKLTHVNFSWSSVEPKLLELILLTCSSLHYLNVTECIFLSGTDVVNKLKSIADTLLNEPTILHDDNDYCYNEHCSGSNSGSECGPFSSDDRDADFRWNFETGLENDFHMEDFDDAEVFDRREFLEEDFDVMEY